MNLKCNVTEVEALEALVFSAFPQKNPFPYQVTAGGHYRCGSSYFTERDSFSESLLLYTCKGCGKIIYRDATWSLPAGAMVLLDGKYAHWYGTAGAEAWDFIWLHFRDLSLVSLADYLFERGVFLQQVPLEEAQALYRSVNDISSEVLRLGTMRLSQLLSSFLTRWGSYSYNRQFSIGEGREQLIRRAQEYIQEHFASEVTLDALASWCSVSKYYLIKLFRKAIGMTPHQYLLHVRISQARLMLLSTSDTVASIGEAVGFSDTSSFIAAFKRIEGTTPLGVRNAKI